MLLNEFLRHHPVGIAFCVGLTFLGLMLTVESVRPGRRWQFNMAIVGGLVAATSPDFLLEGPADAFAKALFVTPILGIALLIVQSIRRRKAGKPVLIMETRNPDDPDRIILRHWITLRPLPEEPRAVSGEG